MNRLLDHSTDCMQCVAAVFSDMFDNVRAFPVVCEYH